MRTTGRVNDDRMRVEVWFGDHVIASYVAEPTLAQRYAAAMSRRFSGLRITVVPLPATVSPPGSDLPTEPLWPLTAK